MNHCMNLDKLTLGVCYYPEHWSPDLWSDDLRRMVEHGIEVIRIGEFAWNFFELTEGEYSFDFFDDFMAVASNFPVKIIFCTPGATPPAWLTEKYPEVLNADIQGHLYRHGTRRHVNYNSPVYRRFCSSITEQLAIHYGNHPLIIGWQIDNELNADINVFHSESDQAAFRVFLEEKYGSLESLNRAWGNVFWNQSYSSWDQVFLPRHTVHGFSNPHLALDEKRFISDCTNRFCLMHSEILRRHIGPDRFITTNGVFKHFDYHKAVSESLDFITFDSYPNMGNGQLYKPGSLHDRSWGLTLAAARSISPVFGVMEQQTGPNGWVNDLMAPTPRPGQMRLWTFQSIANGADFVSFFRWRTCTFGTEMYWHGLIDYDNRDNRRLMELTSIKTDVEKLVSITGAHFSAEIALLRTHDLEWDAENDFCYGPLVARSEAAWYEAATLLHSPLDVVYLDAVLSIDDLAKYKLLVFPHAAMVSEQEAALLEDYVRKGGQLIIGARSGYKDVHGHCPMTAMPGLLRNLCGATVKEFSSIAPSTGPVTAVMKDGLLDMDSFMDVLEPDHDQVKVLARYLDGYCADQPAVVENDFGLGKCIYFGSAFNRKSVTAFLRYLSLDEPFSDLVSLPDSCELLIRNKCGKEYFFILNFHCQAAEIIFHTDMHNLLEDRVVNGVYSLAPFGVMVLEKCEHR